MSINKEDLAYIAGLFDGEGSISISKCKYRYCNRYVNKDGFQYYLEIQICNSFRDVLQFCQDIFNAGCIIKKKRYKDNHKQCWSWKTNTKSASEIITLLLPYLIIKRKQAELALEFQNTVKNKNLTKIEKQTIREEIKNKIKLLNETSP